MINKIDKQLPLGTCPYATDRLISIPCQSPRRKPPKIAAFGRHFGSNRPIL